MVYRQQDRFTYEGNIAHHSVASKPWAIRDVANSEIVGVDSERRRREGPGAIGVEGVGREGYPLPHRPGGLGVRCGRGEAPVAFGFYCIFRRFLLVMWSKNVGFKKPDQKLRLRWGCYLNRWNVV